MRVGRLGQAEPSDVEEGKRDIQDGSDLWPEWLGWPTELGETREGLGIVISSLLWEF